MEILINKTNKIIENPIFEEDYILIDELDNLMSSFDINYLSIIESLKKLSKSKYLKAIGFSSLKEFCKARYNLSSKDLNNLSELILILKNNPKLYDILINYKYYQYLEFKENLDRIDLFEPYMTIREMRLLNESINCKNNYLIYDWFYNDLFQNLNETFKADSIVQCYFLNQKIFILLKSPYYNNYWQTAIVLRADGFSITYHISNKYILNKYNEDKIFNICSNLIINEVKDFVYKYGKEYFGYK